MEEHKNRISNYIIGKIENHETTYMGNIINVMTINQGEYKQIPKIPISDKHHIWFDIRMSSDVVSLQLMSDDDHLLEDDDEQHLIINPTTELMRAFREYLKVYIDRMSNRVILDTSLYLKGRYERT